MAQVTQEYILRVTAEGLRGVANEIKALRRDMSGMETSTAGIEGGFTRVGRRAGELDRNLKGTAGATNNASKAFSKMSQGMSGILVPAYATVAANVFALTAAFGALERAADTQQLIKSSQEFAVQTGRNLEFVARRMKEITNGALSMKEGLTQASIAASAGFDTSTMERLTQVAKNASVALGRDLTDSMNRVFKGAIKAEPELLDELGIILRLDPAAKKYAATLGKSVQQLTTFEKQQAVVNEVLAQGEEKFARFSEINTNPYTQLSAAFSDVATSLLSIVNIGVTPIFEFFAKNTTALTAALIIFANTVLKRAIPAIGDFGEALRTQIVGQLEEAGSKLRIATVSKNTLGAITGTFTGIEDAIVRSKNSVKIILQEYSSEFDTFGEKSGKDFEKIFFSGKGQFDTKKLTRGLRAIDSELARISKGAYGAGEAVEAYKVALTDLRATSEGWLTVQKRVAAGELEVTAATETRILQLKALKQQLIQGIALTKAGVLNAFLGGLGGGISGVRESISDLVVEFGKADLASSKLGKTFKGVGTGLAILSGSFGVLAGWGLKLIPIIGQVVIAWELLSTIIPKVFGGNEKAIEDTTKALEDYSATVYQTEKTINRFNNETAKQPKTLTNTIKYYEIQKNVLTELTSATKDVLDNTQGFYERFGADINDFTDNLNKQADVLIKLGYAEQVNKILKEFGNGEEIAANKAEKAGRALNNLSEEVLKLNNALYEANKGIEDNIDNLNTAFDKFKQSLPQLSPIQEVFVNLTNSLRSLSSANLLSGLEAINNLNSNLLRAAGLEKLAQDITSYNTALNTLIEERTKLYTDQTKAIENYANATAKVNEAERAVGVAGVYREVLAKKQFEEAEARVKSNVKNILALDEAISVLESNATAAYKAVIAGLEVYKEDLDKAIKSQQQLARETQKLNFIISNAPGLSTESIIGLNRQLKDAQVQALTTTLSNAEKSIGYIEGALKTAEEEFKRFSAAYERAKNDSTTTDADRAALAQENVRQQAQLAQLTAEQTKLENLRATTSLQVTQANIEEYTKLVNIITDLNSSLADTKSSTQQAELNKQLTYAADLLNQIGYNFDYTTQGVENYKNGIIDALNAELELARVIKDLRSIKTLEQLNQEKKAFEERADQNRIANTFLKETGTLLSDQVDQQQILYNLELDRQLALNNRLLQYPAIYNNEKKVQEIISSINLIEELRTENAKERADVIKNTQDSLTAQLNQEASMLELEALYAGVRNKDSNVYYATQKKALELGIKGLTLNEKQVEQIEKISKLQTKIKLYENISSASSDITKFGNIIADLQNNLETLDNPFDKWLASIYAIKEVSDQTGNKLTTMFSNLSVVAAEFAKQSQAGTNPKNAVVLASVLDAVSTGFNEGSDAANALKLASQALVLVDAVDAVLTQAKGEPYTAFARMAAMAAAVAGLLNQIGLTFVGSNSGGTGQAEKIQSKFSDTGVYGLSLQNNSISNGLEELININTDLFSVERELQISVVKLTNSLDKLGSTLYKNFNESLINSLSKNKTSTSVNTGGGLGALTTGLSGANFIPGVGDFLNNLLFGSTTQTKELLATGLELAASIQVVSGRIVGSFTSAKEFILKQITETSSGGLLGGLFGGGGTSSDLKLKLQSIDSDISSQLTKSFDAMLNTLNYLFETLTSKTGTNLEELLSKFTGIVIDKTKLNLKDKSAQEQADIIAAYYTDISDKIIKGILPGIEDFSVAGEQLTDTLVRLIKQTVELDNMFSIIGTSLNDIVFSGIDTAAQIDLYKTGIQEQVTAQINEINNQIDTLLGYTGQKLNKTARKELELALESAYIGVDIKAGSAGKFKKSIQEIVNNLQNDILDLQGTISVEASDYSINALNAFTEALLSNFPSPDVLVSTFDKFSKAIYTQDELTQIAIDKSQKILENGYSTIIDYLTQIGQIDLASYLGDSITKDTLRAFYDAAKKAGLFAATLDNSTAQFNTSGADLQALLFNLGAAFIDVQEATKKADTALADFERDLLRQIQAFGKLGKEFDLLQLQFDYEDTIKKAQELGANLTLVEQLYGLKRLDIIKRYNEEIQNSLETLGTNISNSILNVIKSFAGWDEVAYQLIRINKLRDRLSKSLENVNIGVDFSAFNNIDSSNLDQFVQYFGDFIKLSDTIPGNIQEQIALVDELQQAIVDRYNAEETAVTNLKSLAEDISSYLKSLAISDLSIATNSERLAEAQRQFTDNLKNTFSEDTSLRDYATKNLTSSAQKLLELSSQFYGIGPQYQDLYKNVITQLQTVTSQITAPQLTDDGIAITSLQEKTLAQLQVLDDIRTQLEIQNSTNLSAEIATFVKDLTIPLNLITDILQKTNDKTWAPILDALANNPYYTISAANDLVMTSLQEKTLIQLQALNDIASLQEKTSAQLVVFKDMVAQLETQNSITSNLNAQVSTSIEQLMIPLNSITDTLQRTNNQTLLPIRDYIEKLVNISQVDSIQKQLEANNAINTDLATGITQQLTIPLNLITDTLQKINNQTWIPILDSLTGLNTIFQNTYDTSLQEKTLTQQLQVFKDMVTQLEIQNSTSLSTELSIFAQQLIMPINLITDTLRQINDQTWIPILDSLTGLNIPSYDTGTTNVPFDQLAMVHKGEMVLSEEISNYIRDSATGNTPSVYNTYNKYDQSAIDLRQEEVVNAIRTLIQVVAETQRGILEQGQQIVNNTKEKPAYTPIATTKKII